MSYDKPLPVYSNANEAAEYWEGAREERLRIQHCEECGEYVFPPRVGCPYCLSSELTGVDASGEGEVFTFSVVHHPPTEVWEDEVPYAIGIIHLVEDVYVFSQIVTPDPLDVDVGDEVEVVFDHVTEDVTLPKFQPV